MKKIKIKLSEEKEKKEKKEPRLNRDIRRKLALLKKRGLKTPLVKPSKKHRKHKKTTADKLDKIQIGKTTADKLDKIPIGIPTADKLDKIPIGIPTDKKVNYANLCTIHGGQIQWHDMCKNNNCPGLWTYEFKDSEGQIVYSGKDKPYSNFHEHYKAYATRLHNAAVADESDGFDGAAVFDEIDFGDPEVKIGSDKFTFSFGAGPAFGDDEYSLENTMNAEIIGGSFTCEQIIGEPGAEDNTEDDNTEDDTSEEEEGANSLGSNNKQKFYAEAVNVTGVDDEEEAVKIIQRALVEMGLYVHERGLTGKIHISVPKGSKADDELNTVFNQLKDRYAFRAGPEVSEFNWPNDEQKYMIDGNPGPRTQNAVKILQHLAKDTMSGSSKLGTYGPHNDGVDGIVGPLTWKIFKLNLKRKNISSLETRAPESDDEASVPDTVVPGSDDSGGGSAPAATQARTNSNASVTNMFTGLDSFDEKIAKSFDNGALMIMAIKKRDIALVPRDKSNQSSNPLIKDALTLYENLDGMDLGGEDNVKTIIYKYCHRIDLMAEQEFNRYSNFALFSEHSQNYFKGHALYYAYSGRLKMEESEESGDLIKWLIDDYLQEESNALSARLHAESYIAGELLKAQKGSIDVNFNKMKTLLKEAGRKQEEFLKRLASSSKSRRTRSRDPEQASQQTNFVRQRDQSGRDRGFRPAGPGED